MNLLPKNHKEFSKEKFWNEFFTKLQSSPFEWYGEYDALGDTLDKYMKQKDKLLVVGCGNSTLSADLYNVGHQNIVNIDISETVIKQMNLKYRHQYPDMIFKQMDMCKMNFENEEFSVVLDKGTLDAIMVDSSEETLAKVDQAFCEISRVLKYTGRYICISLLQEHILKKVLGWFVPNGYMIRIHRCFEAENKLPEHSFSFPVFVVVCTKFKQIPGSSAVLELALDQGNSLTRVSDTMDVIDSISFAQYIALLKHQKNIEDNIMFELCCAKTGKAKYQLYMVDSDKTSSLKFAIFIVPQGREVEWLFSAPDGRQELARNANCGRLIVVHLLRDFSYNNMDEIKADLSAHVMELAPAAIDAQVPFLSVGDDLGWREIREKGTSEFSGQYVIEDILGEDLKYYRRLVFMNNPFTIQSEAKLMSASSRRRKGKNKPNLKVDYDYLSCDHHYSMVSGLAFLDSSMLCPKILVVGLGGGGLAMYLHRHLPEATVDAVELDSQIVTIAKTWYGVETDSKLSVFVADGIHFMKEALEKGSHYDAIMLDADNKDVSLGMSCPPASFVSTAMLSTMSKLVGDSGVVMINLVCRNDVLKKQVCSDIVEVFPTVFHKTFSTHLNNVLYCTNAASENVKRHLEFQAEQLQSYIEKQCNSSSGFDVKETIKCLERVT